MPILTAEERVGHVVAGRYRIQSILRSGGMGVVFTGVHTWTDRPVAVKILSPEHSTNETAVDRFLREARAAARIDHPNVVDVLDMGEDTDGTVFLVLELLEGEPLSTLLECEGPLEPARTFDVMIPVMRALHHAHRCGIIHRDIKPDNIFLARHDDGGTVPKVLDFGIAKLAESAQAKGTVTGTVIGTPHYMAPEQAMGADEMGPGVDVWSVAVVLYECLSGALPFPGEHATRVLVAIANGQREPLAERAPSLPAPLVRCIERALVTEPERRYRTMRSFAAALIEAADEAAIPLTTSRELGPEAPEVVVHRRSDGTPGQVRLSGPSTSDPGSPTVADEDASPASAAAVRKSAPGPRSLLADKRTWWIAAATAALVTIVAIALRVPGGGDEPRADEGEAPPPAANEPAATPPAAEPEPRPATGAETDEPGDPEPESGTAAASSGAEAETSEDAADSAQQTGPEPGAPKPRSTDRDRRGATRRAAAHDDAPPQPPASERPSVTRGREPPSPDPAPDPPQDEQTPQDGRDDTKLLREW